MEGRMTISLRKTVARWLLPGVATLFLACTAATLHIPAELASAPRLPVKGRQGWLPGRRLQFGEYESRRRGRESLLTGWPVSRVTGLAAEPFGFGLRTYDRELWNADCDPIAHAPEAEGAAPLASPLRCTFAPVSGDTSRTWRLVVVQAMNQPPHGDLVGPDNTRLDVLGTATDAQLGGIVGGVLRGYYIVDGTRTLAAVEVVNAGAVWFDPGLAPERRDLVAAVAAAVLLWDYLMHQGR